MHRRFPNTDAVDCGSCEPERDVWLGLSGYCRGVPLGGYGITPGGGERWIQGADRHLTSRSVDDRDLNRSISVNLFSGISSP
jgi:hypothetical protein